MVCPNSSHGERARSPLMEGVEGKYRSPWREIEVGKVPTEQICRGVAEDEGARAPSRRRLGRRLLQLEDGSWGKRKKIPFSPGPALYRTENTTGSSGQGP